MNKNPRISPESEAFQKLKGEIVEIVWVATDSDFLRGKLIWVDHYTLGVEETDPRSVGKSPWVVYKHAIQMIRKLG